MEPRRGSGHAGARATRSRREQFAARSVARQRVALTVTAAA
ncbi:MAG: hypothetical protein ACK559_40760 [bacterium]